MSDSKKLKIEDFKEQILLCTRCSYCREQEVDNTHAICPIRENTPGFESFIAKGKMIILSGVLDGDLDITPRMAEIFFTCTTCGNCKSHCPVLVKTTEIFEAFRQDLQDQELGLPVHISLGKYCAENNNPYNEPHKNRLNWLPNNDKSHINKPSKLLYFVGCTASYRSTEISKIFYNILTENQVDFTILEDEFCCGSPFFRTGQASEAERVARANIKKLKDFGIQEIVFTCAGCQKTFEENYGQFNGTFKLHNYMDLLLKFIDEKKINFSKTNPVKVTYHDPCHLTKKVESKVDYETPRNILNQMPGVELVEMKSHKEGSMCCGAGGGMKAGNPDLALKIALARFKEVLDTEADVLLSSCPFCKRNLKDAAENLKSKVKVMDIIEFIEERMKRGN